ncbi:hypothetical protein [Mucilaginibacter jinjuensis]|uniref:Uncharacterized protein n=1 Tax=Mucilaginibacter jinjuensis TaxID=1176721 RepID=A0ABY7T3L2_9SPHI|nr:hypothetical protein [Mucilaginibacter jinjuensis]WCT10966.1 hypothetical protein PQO05_19705 [Mucilaginibacter jinjuensis]
MSPYITVNTTAEFICFVVSLLCLYKDKDPVWRLLILFLLVTSMVEVGGIYMRRVLQQPNFMLYNVFLVIECLVESYFFYHLYKTYYNRFKLFGSWAIIFLFVYFAELITNKYAGFVFITFTVVSVVLVLASVYYYYLVLREDQFRSLSVYAPFWWVSGTLCFYFAGTASNIFFSYLAKDRAPIINHSVRYVVFNILNIVLYLNWSYSFICRYRQRTSSSLSD